MKPTPPDDSHLDGLTGSEKDFIRKFAKLSADIIIRAHRKGIVPGPPDPTPKHKQKNKKKKE